MDLRPKRKAILNNSVGNIILEAGATYEITFPEDSLFPKFKTILSFLGQYANGYCFKVVCKKHLAQFQHNLYVDHDFITYQREDLESATFKRSNALDVLYGCK